jgi:hypothetical protein
MSLMAIVLLVAAVALLGAAEWPRLMSAIGVDARRERLRRRKKANLRVVPPLSESEEFARSVERDLASLPTIDEHDAKRR